MVAIPTIEEEDARRPNRERQNLVTEQTRIVNQTKAVFARFGIRTFRPTLRKAEEKLKGLRTAEGTLQERHPQRPHHARRRNPCSTALTAGTGCRWRGECLRERTRRADDSQGMACVVLPHRSPRGNAIRDSPPHAPAWLWLCPGQCRP